MYHFILAALGIILPLLTGIANANVEKTIFLAPAETKVPSGEPDIDDLGVERLSPENPVVRTRLNASFPTTSSPEGSESWFFLENLTPGQRYEVRVCWLATQPTEFTLTTHELSATIEDAALLSSLSVFSSARLAALDSGLQTNALKRRASAHGKESSDDPAPTTDSVLFLRVRAVADYFTTDEALMRNVEPVAVDLILDPFLWNVFPRSLVPTAGWIVVVAVIAIFVARWVAAELGRVIDDARRAREIEEKKGR
ncbi:hypothetical protein N7492_002009 [Penicillium capsulatum]|uniref:Uncharacterized protein n=1 Tax=Penicillium capsulatum TaxID=69766 RepID=A0A9W9IH15_9EURO|nr:hypothetical protein N7492_002009 [Penicillium capsulatum]KAJ6123371.1 hypothetical protein N7512_005836 [Penicillium capsulatum]